MLKSLGRSLTALALLAIWKAPNICLADSMQEIPNTDINSINNRQSGISPIFLATLNQLVYRDKDPDADELPADVKLISRAYNVDFVSTKAMAVYNGKLNLLIVVFAGTDFSDPSDVAADIAITANTIKSVFHTTDYWTSQKTPDLFLESRLPRYNDTALLKYSKIERFYYRSRFSQAILDNKIDQAHIFVNDAQTAVKAHYGKAPIQTVITGHSLGGLVSQVIGSNMNLPSVTFNAPGLPLSLAWRYGVPFARSDKNYNYAREGDLVDSGNVFSSSIVNHGHTLRLRELPDSDLSSAMKHSISITALAVNFDPDSLTFILPLNFRHRSIGRTLTKASVWDISNDLHLFSLVYKRRTENLDIDSRVTKEGQDPRNAQTSANDTLIQHGSTPTPNHGAGEAVGVSPADVDQPRNAEIDESRTATSPPRETAAHDETDDLGDQATIKMRDASSHTPITPANPLDGQGPISVGIPDTEEQLYPIDIWERRAAEEAERRSDRQSKDFARTHANVDPAAPGEADYRYGIGERQSPFDQPRNIDPYPDSFLEEMQGNDSTERFYIPANIDPLPPDMLPEPKDDTKPNPISHPEVIASLPTSGGPSHGSSSAGSTIVLGVGAPLSGPESKFGNQILAGAQRAVDDFNSHGGVLGYKLSVKVGDDESDPKMGVSVANKFVGDGVKVVVGHFDSSVMIPASSVYENYGMLVVSPSASDPLLTEGGKQFAFRLHGSDAQQELVAAEFIGKRLNGEKIAVVNDGDQLNVYRSDQMVEYLKRFGNPSIVLRMPKGQMSSFDGVNKLMGDNVRLIYWIGRLLDGVNLLNFLRIHGIDVIFMSNDAIYVDKFVAAAGENGIGVLTTAAPDARTSASAAQIVKRFRINGIEPEGYTLYGYAAVQIIVLAMLGSKSTDTRKIVEYMHSGVSFLTVIGNIRFDKRGDRLESEFKVVQWRKVAGGVRLSPP